MAQLFINPISIILGNYSIFLKMNRPHCSLWQSPLPHRNRIATINLFKYLSMRIILCIIVHN